MAMCLYATTGSPIIGGLPFDVVGKKHRKSERKKAEKGRDRRQEESDKNSLAARPRRHGGTVNHAGHEFGFLDYTISPEYTACE